MLKPLASPGSGQTPATAQRVDGPCKPIALLIPVWNRHAKLQRALDSLINEAALLKVVVIDDGSEPPIQLEPHSPLDTQLIRLSANQGICGALNAGLTYAFAHNIPYIARLDSDDIALNGRFLKQLTFMESNKEIGICGGGYQEYNPDNEQSSLILLPRHDHAIRQGMHIRTTLWHPTVMLRTSVARRAGYYNSAYKCEDIHYFLQILKIAKAANLPDVLIRYEVGSADALTGTPKRRRALARSLLRLKAQEPEPTKLLWWLGLITALIYFAGLSHHLRNLRNLTTGWLERRSN